MEGKETKLNKKFEKKIVMRTPKEIEKLNQLLN